jgi:hypothetical protein
MIFSYADLLKATVPIEQLMYKKSPSSKTICDFVILYTLVFFPLEMCA